MNLTFELTRGSVLVVAALLLAIPTAWWSYRRTVPPLPRPVRVGLAVMRGLALALLIILLGDPVIRVERTVRFQPVLAVLLDASSSMSRSDDGARRIDHARLVLDAVVKTRRDGSTRVYPFSAELEESIPVDSFPMADGNATALGEALSELDRDGGVRDSLGAVLVLSDGANNFGADPSSSARRLGVPVFAVALGDPAPPTDVSVARVESPEIAYAGVDVPVSVVVRAAGREGTSTTVSLAIDEEPVDRQVVPLGPDDALSRVRFVFTPDRTGRHVLTAKVSGGEDDVPDNDGSSRPITVRPSRVRVLVVPGVLSWETTFLMRALRDDDDLEVDGAVPLGGGRFASSGTDPRSVDPADYDVVFLLDPDDATFSLWGERLTDAVRSGACGLGVFYGGRVVSAAPRGPHRDLVPMDLSYGLGWLDDEFRPVVSAGGGNHPLVQLADAPDVSSSLWRSLPPFSGFLLGEVRSDVAVLCSHPRTGSPVLTLHQVGRGRVVSLWGGPVWRWAFAPPSRGGSRAAHGRFVGNLVRVLAVRGEMRRVRVRSDSPVVRAGEPIPFEVQVYDEDGRPRRGSRVSACLVTPEGDTVEVVVSEEEDGVFRGRSTGTSPGEAKLIASASDGERTLGTDTVVVTVQSTTLEDLDARARPDILSSVADASGGAVFEPRETDDLLSVLSSELRIREKRTVERTILRSSPIAFALPLVLLIIEWVLRRRRRLV
jgi:hypothetical protein